MSVDREPYSLKRRPKTRQTSIANSLTNEMVALRKQRDELAQLLAKYGRHTVQCAFHLGGHCTCGFDNVNLVKILIGTSVPQKPVDNTKETTDRLVSWFRVNMRTRADECGDLANKYPTDNPAYQRNAGAACVLHNTANEMHMWVKNMPKDYDSDDEPYSLKKKR